MGTYVGAAAQDSERLAADRAWVRWGVAAALLPEQARSHLRPGASLYPGSTTKPGSTTEMGRVLREGNEHRA
jgi:hypothetical protein